MREWDEAAGRILPMPWEERPVSYRIRDAELIFKEHWERIDEWVTVLPSSKYDSSWSLNFDIMDIAAQMVKMSATVDGWAISEKHLYYLWEALGRQMVGERGTPFVKAYDDYGIVVITGKTRFGFRSV